MLKFFRLPFATTGDKTPVPDATDSNGGVSYSQGYGFDYQRQKTDPAAKNIERDKMNQVFFDITTALAELQGQGAPDFITTALNGGTAFSYSQFAIVKYSGALYLSLVAANTALPSDATKWALLPTPALLQQAAYSSATAGGTVDAITAAFVPAIAALPAAPATLSLVVRAAGANATAAPTFKADALAAKTIVKGNNLPLAVGDIPGTGAWLWLLYDATLDKFVLQNPATGIGGVTAANLQAQTFTAFASGGAAPAFTLTPTPAITAYASGQRFRVAFAAAGTTGSNTLNVSGRGVKNVKQYDATGGKVPAIITAAQLADVEYDGTDFVILDPLPGGLGAPVGSARNLRMSVAAASASATLTADEVIVETALGGAAYRLAAYSQAVNLATTGAGGMDTGAAPASGFVSLYAIYNPTTNAKNLLACMVTTSSGAIYSGANMPAGYTASALVGVWPTNGSSQFVVGYQKDRTFWNDAAGVNVLNITATPPTSYTSVSLTSAVPPNAQSVILNVGQPNSGADSLAAVVAATTSGAGSAVANLPGNNLVVDSFYSGVQAVVPLVTAQTIYYKVGTSVRGFRINVTGYSF